jgi:hypothetical protein
VERRVNGVIQNPAVEWLPEWYPLCHSVINGRFDWNSDVREAMHNKSGVYAFRKKNSKGVSYVGESHTDNLWRTAIRHFQGVLSGKFEARREWVRARPQDFQIAWLITDRKDAFDQESQAIFELEPSGNNERVVEVADEEEIPF